MLASELIVPYNPTNHCTSEIKLGDIVAVLKVRIIDMPTMSFVDVQLRKSTKWPNGLQQGENLNRFRFIPASQHYRALKYGDIPTTGEFN